MYPLEGQAQPAIVIHSPRTGRDVATSCRAAVSGENFNLLSPYGKRRGRRLGKQPGRRISIHSPHTGRDYTRQGPGIIVNKFQSTLPARGETLKSATPLLANPFQSTLPIREETRPRHRDGCPLGDFNPLFPYGNRPAEQWTAIGDAIFQSTLPIREETPHPTHSGRSIQFQSTLPIREETVSPAAVQMHGFISIHSSHTGRDTRPRPNSTSCWRISIHSSHTGRDLLPGLFAGLFPYFNPLFPYGKRRAEQLKALARLLFQSTLPIREETLADHPTYRRVIISIHSPHTGRDRSAGVMRQRLSQHFNPLSPHGERRLAALGPKTKCPGISIHSPHTGRDVFAPTTAPTPPAISIHSPHTGRDDCVVDNLGYHDTISIHSPHTGRDLCVSLRLFRSVDFNPLSPHGERRAEGRAFPPDLEFQSTLPTRGETPHTVNCVSGQIYFNPLSPHGERHASQSTAKPC